MRCDPPPLPHGGKPGMLGWTWIVYNISLCLRASRSCGLKIRRGCKAFFRIRTSMGADPASGIRTGRDPSLYLSPFQRDGLTSWYPGVMLSTTLLTTIRWWLGVILIAEEGLLSQPLSPIGSLLNIGCLYAKQQAMDPMPTVTLGIIQMFLG